MYNICMKLLIIILIIGILYYIGRGGSIKIIKCRENTLNNPYGNYLLNSDDPELSSCGNEQKAYDFSTFNLYKNSYNKESERDFYTTPYSTYPNNSHNFTMFLMHKQLTCKENGFCRNSIN